MGEELYFESEASEKRSVRNELASRSPQRALDFVCTAALLRVYVSNRPPGGPPSRSYLCLIDPLADPPHAGQGAVAQQRGGDDAGAAAGGG
eukprot:475176-Prorocentrum_minimum.AAC.1